jgi:hypothetical protein
MKTGTRKLLSSSETRDDVSRMVTGQRITPQTFKCCARDTSQDKLKLG